MKSKIFIGFVSTSIIFAGASQVEAYSNLQIDSKPVLKTGKNFGVDYNFGDNCVAKMDQPHESDGVRGYVIVKARTVCPGKVGSVTVTLHYVDRQYGKYEAGGQQFKIKNLNWFRGAALPCPDRNEHLYRAISIHRDQKNIEFKIQAEGLSRCVISTDETIKSILKSILGIGSLGIGLFAIYLISPLTGLIFF